MQNVYSNTEGYNPGREREVLIVFDDMTSDMISNKKISIRRIKLNISVVFITQFYFVVLTGIWLISTHFFFFFFFFFFYHSKKSRDSENRI